MNFQPDGGYSIALLNDPHGPALFLAMCVATVALTHGYFVYNGFIEPLVTWEGLRRGLFRRVPGFGPWRRRGARGARTGPGVPAAPVGLLGAVGRKLGLGGRGPAAAGSPRTRTGSRSRSGSGSGGVSGIGADSPGGGQEREPLVSPAQSAAGGR